MSSSNFPTQNIAGPLPSALPTPQNSYLLNPNTPYTPRPQKSPGRNVRGGQTGVPIPLDDPRSVAFAQQNISRGSGSTNFSTGSQRRIGSQAGIPVSYGEDAIARFLASNPNCSATAQDVLTFLTIEKVARFNGRQLLDIVRTAWEFGLVPQRVYDSIGRAAGMSFTDQTLGLRGRSQAQIKPSLLWAIASRECQNLAQLNQVLIDVAEKNFGFDIPPAQIPPSLGTPSQALEENEALALFFTTHPSVAQNQLQKESIYQFLNLVDSYHLNQQDLLAILGTLEYEGKIPQMPTRGFRSAGMTLSPATLGVRGSQRDQVKHSLLWLILDKYAPEMDTIVSFMVNGLSGKIRQRVLSNMSQGILPTVAPKAM